MLAPRGQAIHTMGQSTLASKSPQVVVVGEECIEFSKQAHGGERGTEAAAAGVEFNRGRHGHSRPIRRARLTPQSRRPALARPASSFATQPLVSAPSIPGAQRRSR
jgi:hypothetical protein